MGTHRHYQDRVMLLFGILGLAACSAASTPERRDATDGAASEPHAAAKLAPVPKIIAEEPRNELSESDRSMLKSAEAACKHKEFSPFFEAAVRSKAVRQRFFKLPILTTTGAVSADRYEMPISMADVQYISFDSASKTPREWEYVKLDINYAQDERVRVDWVRIDYGPTGNDPGADDGGAHLADDKEYGPRGFLIFKPTAECWALVEDGVER